MASRREDGRPRWAFDASRTTIWSLGLSSSKDHGSRIASARARSATPSLVDSVGVKRCYHRTLARCWQISGTLLQPEPAP